MLQDGLLQRPINVGVSPRAHSRSGPRQAFGGPKPGSLDQGLYVLAPSYGPKGLDIIAQGLPWVNSLYGMGPEGAVWYSEDRLSTGLRTHFRVLRRFRANHVYLANPG